MSTSDVKYRNLLERMTDGFISVDMAGNILETNQAFREMVGYTNDELLLLTYHDLTPEWWHPVEKSIVESQILPDGHSVVYEKEYRRNDGSVFPVELRTFLIRNETGQEEGMWAIVRDITEKKRNIKTKEVLLREIHHRVKNNLAIVNSLLNFELNASKNPELTPIIRDIQLRIRSIALIHEHLYNSENLDRIPLADYITSLANNILSTFSSSRLTIDYEIEPVNISIEKALPIGLIINELLTNAFKYAFPAGKYGTIRICLCHSREDTCELEISDNGVGIPGSVSLESAITMGFFIIRILTEQLEGKMELRRDHGTSFRLRCRIN
ncbi:MAG: PAS domain S-box protein [Bacteroidales bacterium]|nr:PAS domain S-box protein [Bacteroidales bacterium]